MEDRLTRGRQARLEFVDALLHSDRPASRRQVIEKLGAQRGFLVKGARWADERLDAAWAPGWEPVVNALGGEDLPELDAASAVLLETLEQAGQPELWSEPIPPLVYRTGERNQIRAGMFTWATDRDAFLTELLGRQVPLRPRYLRTAPAWPIEVESLEDIQADFGVSIDEAQGLYRQGREEALRNPNLGRVVARAMAGVPHGGPAAALVEASAGNLEGLPLVRFLAPLLRAAPRWRAARTQLDFVVTTDLGIGGVVGYAQWVPAMPELRHLRRTLAAHLRYLFDHHVAPWRHFRDRRSSHEAFLLYFRTRWIPEKRQGMPDTIKRLAAHWRRQWPEDYHDEPERTTVARLYRINQRLVGIGSLDRTNW